MQSRQPGGLPTPASYVIGGALALWLLVAAAVTGAVWYERQRVMDQARSSAAATTALLEAHTANTFQVVDLALDEVARRLESAPAARHQEDVSTLMRARLEGLPYVRALYVIGPDGFIQHDTDYPRTPGVTLADRDYFVAHRNDPARVRGISSPLLSRSGTGWFVAVTRRIGDGQQFRGVAVAAMQLRYFSDLYERMGLGEGHHIALFHRDGRLIAQHPPEEGLIGSTYADYPLFRTHLPQHPRGVYLTSGPPLPFERIFSYDTVRTEPLVVSLAVDTGQALAGWRRTAAIAATALAVLLAALVGAAMLLLRLQADRRLLRDRQQQGEKMEALGQLTGIIAHDFANVLNIVAANLELLRRAGLEGRSEAALGRAQRAVESGTGMTRQLMSFARKREAEVQVADLHELLRQVEPLLAQAAGQGVAVRLDLADGPAPVHVDRGPLEVALINLVVNARDAMDGQGNVVLRTQIQVRRGGSRVGRREPQRYMDLAVQDDGPGMPEEVRRRAMEPFFTTKGEGGTGLGLAQVYGLLQQLGGEVEIESRPGEGTTVHLLLRAD